MRKVSEIIINILTVIVFLMLAIVIFAKVQMLVTGNDYFKLFGYSFFNVATGSMQPTINENDAVIVKIGSEYGVDDIITFKKDDTYITHRVIMVNDDNLITKGDANNTNDVIISKEYVLGKVVKILPNAGIWQKTFTSPKVIIMIFITLLAFDFVFSYKGFKKDNKKIDTKVDDSKIDLDKLSQDDLKKLNEKVNNIETKKEKENLEYTIGLDLMSIQKEINYRLNKR